MLGGILIGASLGGIIGGRNLWLMDIHSLMESFAFLEVGVLCYASGFVAEVVYMYTGIPCTCTCFAHRCTCTCFCTQVNLITLLVLLML